MITMKAISFCFRLMLLMVCFITWNVSWLSSSTTSILAFVEAFPLPNTHCQRAAAGHHQSRMIHGTPRHNGKTSARDNPSAVATELYSTYGVERLLSSAVSDVYGTSTTITAATATATDADHQAVALLATISDTTATVYGGLPASGGSDDVGVAVDAVLGVSNAGNGVDGVTDISLALAGGVAVFALLALVALQIMPPPTSSSSSTRGGGTPTIGSSTAKSTEGTGSAGMTSQATATTASSASPTTVRKGAIADERGDNSVSGTTMLDDESAVFDGRPKDDLTIEEDRALKSFDDGDRSGLFASLSRLTARIRSTRAQLQEEQTLREASDIRLREVAEEMRTLEDQYELGQNKLVTVQKQLEATQSDLSTTQRDLLIASTTLQKLQEERQSLRKLGRAAITLTKQRLTRRFRKLRGKTDDDEETNQ